MALSISSRRWVKNPKRSGSEFVAVTPRVDSHGMAWWEGTRQNSRVSAAGAIAGFALSTNCRFSTVHRG
jgi:hypothetical protein